MKKVKKEIYKFYKKWRNGRTYCPALKSEVIISLKCWRHITGATGNTKRSINDVYRRLKLLPYAEDIIKRSTTIQDIRKSKDKCFYVLEATVDVEEKGKTAPRKVRVVIIEDKSKKRTLLSVMDKKNKNEAPHA